jgi:hypothetical protein
MQQMQIPVPPVADISMASIAWRKVNNGWNFFYISSWFLTVVISMATESLNHDACSACVPTCASTCTKIFILPLAISDLGFFFIICISSFSCEIHRQK